MIETCLNQLAALATDNVRWPAIQNSCAPDSLSLSGSNLIWYGTENEILSKPVAVHGLEIHTFQFVYEVEPDAEPTSYSLTPSFQVSQDGRHWDDIPSDSFSVDLSTVKIGGNDTTSMTVEVMSKSNFIRVKLEVASVEAEPNHGDILKIYNTSTEG